jgi:hypothetical protein
VYCPLTSSLFCPHIFFGILFLILVIYVLLAGTTLYKHREDSSMYGILIFRVVGRGREDDIPPLN